MGNTSTFQIQAQNLGGLIEGARIHTEKSVEDCAEAMGIPSSDFEAYETGEKAPSLPELEALAYFLDIPIDYFINREPISIEAKEYVAIENIDHLLPLRHRIVGIMMRKARLEAGISLDELARSTEIDQDILADYEQGTSSIPYPELEVISIALSISVKEFQDQNGPIGRWAIQKKAMDDFKELPLEIQQFISKPINLPYLELAQRLSEMSVEKLRSVAEGLLEITL